MNLPIIEELLCKQQESINAFFTQIDKQALSEVLEMMLRCKGTILLTGIGKSGIVAKKIAVTLTSTGTRALFLSPTNALHGDLGVIHDDDLFIAFSKSGESEEVLQLIPYIRNRRIASIAIVSKENSRLACAVDYTLLLPNQKELCPYDLAPTTSTTTQLIVGDLFAISLMKMKNFGIEDFAKLHPAGRIGKRTTLRVSDLMLRGEHIPRSSPDKTLGSLLEELSDKQCGCLLIANKEEKLLGIFTDGDLRRTLQIEGTSALEKKIGELMNPKPRTISSDSLAWDAIKEMESNQKSPITILPVVDESEKIEGILRMHDLIQSGVQ